MADFIPLLSTLLLGLLAGSLLTEATIFVPYWRRMEPAEFFRLHGTLGPNLFRYYAPLTVLAVSLSVGVAALYGRNNTPWLIAGGLCLIALAIFFIYFRAANNRFATHDMPDSALKDELVKWSAWHWTRTIIVIAAFGISIFGHLATSSI